jgi:hypothetical protein
MQNRGGAGCRQPDKIRYPTRAAAEQAMSGALCSPTSLYVPVAAYWCRAGHWHLAHSTWYGRRP